MIKARFAPAALWVALCLSGCSDPDTASITKLHAAEATAAPAATVVPALAPDELLPEALSDVDWTNFSGDGAAQQYSPLDQVNLGNIERLTLAWSYDLESGFSVSSPVKGGDKLFTTTGHSLDRKSTRLNSSHVAISYAVFCLKKKKVREHQ